MPGYKSIDEMLDKQQGLDNKYKKSAKEHYSKYYSKDKSEWENKLAEAEAQGTDNPGFTKKEEEGFRYNVNAAFIKELDVWLIKHGEIDTKARQMVAEFLLKPEDEKLAIWYVVENKKYGALSLDEYISVLNSDVALNTEKVKKNLRKGKFARFKTANYDHLYWGRLGDAVQTVRPFAEKKAALLRLSAPPDKDSEGENAGSDSALIGNDEEINTGAKKENSLLIGNNEEIGTGAKNEESALIGNNEEIGTEAKEDDSHLKKNDEEIDTGAKDAESSLIEPAADAESGKKKDDDDFESKVSRVKSILSEKLNAASEGSEDSDGRLTAIKEEVKKQINLLNYEPDNAWFANTETVVLRLQQAVDKTFKAENIAGENIRFISKESDYTGDGQRFIDQAYFMGQVDNLLTVLLSGYTLAAAIKSRFKDFRNLETVDKILTALTTTNDAAITSQSALSLAQMVKTAVRGNDFTTILSASEKISSRLSTALSHFGAIASAMNSAAKITNLIRRTKERGHSDKANEFLIGNNNGMIQAIGKHTAGLKKDQVREGWLGTISSIATTASSILSLTPVGLGLGLVLGFVGAVGAVATWIAGLRDRKKRRTHLIDSYLGTKNLPEKERAAYRQYAEARLSIVGDERMARYILGKYSRFLYDKVFVNKNKKKIKKRNSEGTYQPAFIPQHYYAGIKSKTIVSPSEDESNDEMRERFGAYEILLAYGIKPRFGRGNDKEQNAPETTENVIREKLQV